MGQNPSVLQMEHGERYACRKCECEVTVTTAPAVAGKGGQGSLVCCGEKMSAKSLATATERVGRATGRVAGKIDKVMASSAASAVKVQHGITIDERAHTRATSGQRWAARQTR